MHSLSMKKLNSYIETRTGKKGAFRDDMFLVHEIKTTLRPVVTRTVTVKMKKI